MRRFAAVAAIAVAVPVIFAGAASAHDHRQPYGGQTSWSQVAPYGTQGRQVYTPLDHTQKLYALEVVQGAEALHMTPYAGVIAVATALQESKFVDYRQSVDHDSLGIFQQRPSEGWGSASQIEDPAYAARSFLIQLGQTDYQHETLTEAAQQVQRSADPYAYAQWQDEAAQIVSQISNGTW